MADVKAEYQAFMDSWTVDPAECKGVVQAFGNLLAGIPGVTLDYKNRPGVSYSLRARGAEQKNRDLFVMVDVVDDEPDNRWLSICFYADLVTDPEEKGDVAPEGLNGEDACCFNYDENDCALASYIADRLKEAAKAATTPGAK